MLQPITIARVRTTTGADAFESVKIALAGQREPRGLRRPRRVAGLGPTGKPQPAARVVVELHDNPHEMVD
jgi:hypothetical protein